MIHLTLKDVTIILNLLFLYPLSFLWSEPFRRQKLPDFFDLGSDVGLMMVLSLQRCGRTSL